MAVAFRREVSIAARKSRSQDAGRRTRCRDVEPMMSLMPAVAVIEQEMNVRQDYRIRKIIKLQSCPSCKIL